MSLWFWKERSAENDQIMILWEWRYYVFGNLFSVTVPLSSLFGFLGQSQRLSRLMVVHSTVHIFLVMWVRRNSCSDRGYPAPLNTYGRCTFIGETPRGQAIWCDPSQGELLHMRSNCSSVYYCIMAGAILAIGCSFLFCLFYVVLLLLDFGCIVWIVVHGGFQILRQPFASS